MIDEESNKMKNTDPRPVRRMGEEPSYKGKIGKLARESAEKAEPTDEEQPAVQRGADDVRVGQQAGVEGIIPEHQAADDRKEAPRPEPDARMDFIEPEVERLREKVKQLDEMIKGLRSSGSDVIRTDSGEMDDGPRVPSLPFCEYRDEDIVGENAHSWHYNPATNTITVGTIRQGDNTRVLSSAITDWDATPNTVVSHCYWVAVDWTDTGSYNHKTPNIYWDDGASFPAASDERWIFEILEFDGDGNPTEHRQSDIVLPESYIPDPTGSYDSPLVHDQSTAENKWLTNDGVQGKVLRNDSSGQLEFGFVAAADVSASTGSFNGVLGLADDTVQKALNTLDDHTHAHSFTTGQTANDHHDKSHAHNGADGSGTVAHGDLLGVSDSDHHNPMSLHADINANLLGISDQELDLDTQTANKVFSGPVSGVDAKPTFRSLVVGDMPDLSASYEPVLVDELVYDHGSSYETCKPKTGPGKYWAFVHVAKAGATYDGHTVPSGKRQYFMQQFCLPLYEQPGYCNYSTPVGESLSFGDANGDLQELTVTDGVMGSFTGSIQGTDPATGDAVTATFSSGVCTDYEGQITVANNTTGESVLLRIDSDGKLKE